MRAGRMRVKDVREKNAMRNSWAGEQLDRLR